MRQRPQRDWVWLLALLALSLLTGSVQRRAAAEGEAPWFAGFVRGALVPLASFIGRALDARDAWLFGIASAPEVLRLRAENARLRAAVALYDERVSELLGEVDALRRFVSLPPVPGRSRVAADVAASFPSENRLVLSVGRRHGVRPGMPVVDGNALVGLVRDAGERSCTVEMVSSPTLRLGAMALRNPPAAGLLRGESLTKLILEFLDFNAPVANNDLVVTSGFSERVPRGIPIGRIFQVEESREFGSRRSQVFPLANLGAVREVWVLR
ncbi:MAG: rod shape-determining protein MreC [Fimbriimonadales bacterium]|nr:rod shape-determining protein MreC [Fimbriimonadales bacterium]